MKGRDAAPTTISRPARPLRELSDAENDTIAKNVALHKEHLPEFAPFVRALHETGLIDGWRAITHIQIIERKEPGHGPD